MWSGYLGYTVVILNIVRTMRDGIKGQRPWKPLVILD